MQQLCISRASRMQQSDKVQQNWRKDSNGLPIINYYLKKINKLATTNNLWSPKHWFLILGHKSINIDSLTRNKKKVKWILIQWFPMASWFECNNYHCSENLVSHHFEVAHKLKSDSIPQSSCILLVVENYQIGSDTSKCAWIISGMSELKSC